ncbi:T-cell surface glycoprotein CD3 epsilon chain-like [Nerophis lumbriciformis]|uniref:T-cell surface glycoprotein CD3 epsilon chain-like n=1 Tax=Nerophis lumbriciformis TaxID=546530 RepID=UPI002ADF0BC0|nr:T-cell surface glycoprotein CD3 epsilon chain-like [Nerophis lumbriciformis]
MKNKIALPWIHLLITVAVAADQGGVSFWKESFKMKCPQDGKWFQGKSEVGPKSSSYTVDFDGNTKGLYHCEYGAQMPSVKYYFYVEGKGCSHCFEMDGVVLGLVIAADVSVTATVMILIYWCVKKRSATQAIGGPVPPSPDYEPLNIHGQDAYSSLNNIKTR